MVLGTKRGIWNRISRKLYNHYQDEFIWFRPMCKSSALSGSLSVDHASYKGSFMDLDCLFVERWLRIISVYNGVLSETEEIRKNKKK